MSLPKEQAISLVAAIYYKMPIKAKEYEPLFITKYDIREERESAKNIALFFCENHIEELKTLPETTETRFHIQYWTDTITEIKGL